MTASPPPDVLDRFAVPDDVERLDGGQGCSVRAGDLALSPDRDPVLQEWLSPVQARLAYELDLAPGRHPLRLVMPVPARDGEWVVDGWAATRFEPGVVVCHDLDLVLATGRLLHAHLASAVPECPALLASPPTSPSRWDRAEALAFTPRAQWPSDLPAPVRTLGALLDDTPLGPSQLVHRDLASNVLLDPRGSALVIDLSPAWRPVLWAEAICVVDCVLWHDAPLTALDAWRTGRERQAMLRALLFRMLSDEPSQLESYRPALDVVVPDLLGHPLAHPSG
ncbi:aminoglycoside phosphotransferase [Salana multivorans]